MTRSNPSVDIEAMAKQYIKTVRKVEFAINYVGSEPSGVTFHVYLVPYPALEEDRRAFEEAVRAIPKADVHIFEYHNDTVID